MAEKKRAPPIEEYIRQKAMPEWAPVAYAMMRQAMARAMLEDAERELRANRQACTHETLDPVSDGKICRRCWATFNHDGEPL
jgi:hypothetical protein